MERRRERRQQHRDGLAGQDGAAQLRGQGCRAGSGKGPENPASVIHRRPSDPTSALSSSPPRPPGPLLPSGPQWFPAQMRLPGSVLDKAAGREEGRGEGSGHTLQESHYALHGVKSTTPYLGPRALQGGRKASNSRARSCLKETAEQTSEAAPDLCFSWPFALSGAEGPRLPDARTSGLPIPHPHSSPASLPGWVTLDSSLLPSEPHFPYL